MIGWVQYLVYILSFFFPPIGVITFWVFSGRNDEMSVVGKWSLLAAFIGIVICCIVAAVGIAPHCLLWPGMGVWR